MEKKLEENYNWSDQKLKFTSFALKTAGIQLSSKMKLFQLEFMMMKSPSFSTQNAWKSTILARTTEPKPPQSSKPQSE